MNNRNPYNRYHQQIILKGFGESAQYKLRLARVFVAGAGGLGCAALQYLASAGVGTIGIADDDVVQVSNLHRQVLFTLGDIGALKTETAAAWLRKLNPEVDIQTYPLRLNTQNILEIISNYDVILDGTDNHQTKYMINDACVLAGKPLVFAAISEFEGQIAVFNYPVNGPHASNYRDVFPNPSADDLSCQENGVLGILPGIIGCMQCNETIKLITGIGKPLVNRLLIYNALTNQMSEFAVLPAKQNRLSMPGNIDEFLNTEYEMPGYNGGDPLELQPEEFGRYINKDNITVIDVREHDRRLSPADFQHVEIPLSILHENLSAISGETIITFCERGILSLRAAKLLREAFGPEIKVYSLQEGINHWNLTRQDTQYD